MSLESIWNYQESLVHDHIRTAADRYPAVAANDNLLADVACIALNSLRPRYVRFSVDLHFFMTDAQRDENAVAVKRAIDEAFQQVQRNLSTRPGKA
ncbi:MAG TPA: late competence development ComFB family protein [Steroidobacteraceae bacterium]|jgi:hypothetical protein|nr:late competence development ComFB family protein [Steroidobacteraceae bacterium]